MSEHELLTLVRDTGKALAAWDEIKRQSEGLSTLDSNKAVAAQGQEGTKIYLHMSKMKQQLLDAAKEYAALWP